MMSVNIINLGLFGSHHDHVSLPSTTTNQWKKKFLEISPETIRFGKKRL